LKKKYNNNNNRNNLTLFFDGKSLDGWKMVGQGKFIVIQDERARLSEGGMGLLWYIKKNTMILYSSYNGEYHIKMIIQVCLSDFLTLAMTHRLQLIRGYEIQIDDLGKLGGQGIHRTGAIYNLAAPSKIVSKPVGQWNDLEIKAIKQYYIVIINHQEVTEFVGNRSLEGYVGLQNHDAKSKVSFRNIRIKEIC
jgi:hypothetical protein